VRVRCNESQAVAARTDSYQFGSFDVSNAGIVAVDELGGLWPKDGYGQIDALLLNRDSDVLPGTQHNLVFVRFSACELPLDRFAQFEAGRINYQSLTITTANLRLQSCNPDEEKQNTR